MLPSVAGIGSLKSIFSLFDFTIFYVKGVLHPQTTFVTVCAFSQTLQHIGDK